MVSLMPKKKMWNVFLEGLNDFSEDSPGGRLCHFGKAEKSSGSGKNLAAAGGRIRRYATAGTNQTSAGHYSFGRASWYFHGNQSPGDTATAPACFCKAVRYSKGLTLFNSQVWIRLMNMSPIWAPLAFL